MWAIKSGQYYLSNTYSAAGERLLGHGGVYSTTNIREFKTKAEALKEAKKIRMIMGFEAKVVRLEDEKK